MADQQSMHQKPLDLDRLLACSRWFLDLPPDVRSFVRARTGLRSLDKGESLSHQGMLPVHWFGLVDGMLKWSVLSADGRATTLGGILPGCWFGEGGVLRQRPRQAEIIALQPSQVATLAIDDFAHLLQSQLSFKDFILGQLSERLYYFMDSIADARLLSPDLQVAYALCGLMHPLNNPLGLRKLRISQDELANLASVSRSRCNTALGLLRDQGMVRTEYGGLVLLDVASLYKMVGLNTG